MSLLGNILWLIFGGFITGLGYILGGIVLCLTIIGIPFGLQSIKLGFAVDDLHVSFSVWLVGLHYLGEVRGEAVSYPVLSAHSLLSSATALR